MNKLLVLALVLLVGVVMAKEIPNEAKVGGFAIGPQAYSFKEYTFYEAIDKAKEAGCSVIEAYPGQRLRPGDDTKFSHLADPEDWAKAKMKLEATGVRLVNYGVVGFKNEEEARKIFDFAKIMDIPAISTEPADASPETFDLIEKLVKEYDIKVGIHNHPKKENNPNYKWWNPTFVLEQVEGRDLRIGLACDTGHWIRSGLDPLPEMKKVAKAGRIVSMHLKDLHEASREGHDVPYGTGVSDVGAILDVLKDCGFNGNISIEYEYNWTTSVPEIAQCVDFVREHGKVSP
jgi:sugar phosphate isomerase/epimerase